MKIYKIILVVLIMTIMFGCSSNDDNPLSAYIGNAFKLSVVNENGQDLLNPGNQGSFIEEEITLFYTENGEKKEIFEPNLQYPKLFRIHQRDDKFIITLFPHVDKNQNPMTTLIKWRDNEVDTLKVKSSFYENSVFTEKVWFNENLIWEKEDNLEKYREIVK